MALVRNGFLIHKTFHSRAVAPVIATLLMVAIALVGGTIIFVFSQSFFSEVQISGTPQIESIEIFGYDSRNVNSLNDHNGFNMTVNSGGDPTTIGKNKDERIAVYIQSKSPQPIYLSEIRLGGTVYTFSFINTPDVWNGTSPPQGSYSLLKDSFNGIAQEVPMIKPGGILTVLIDLDDYFPIGRDTQFKLTTQNGNIFVGTIFFGSFAAGSQSQSPSNVICHIPGGDPEKAETIVIHGYNLEKHLGHGDTLGPCP